LTPYLYHRHHHKLNVPLKHREKNHTSHRLLTTPEVLEEKKKLREEKDRKEKLKEERLVRKRMKEECKKKVD
jgi:hypothetical protein